MSEIMVDSENGSENMIDLNGKDAKDNILDAKAGARNFRASRDIENFYRFIHENDLRREARMVLELIHSKLTAKKERKPRAKKQLH